MTCNTSRANIPCCCSWSSRINAVCVRFSVGRSQETLHASSTVPPCWPTKGGVVDEPNDGWRLSAGCAAAGLGTAAGCRASVAGLPRGQASSLSGVVGWLRTSLCQTERGLSLAIMARSAPERWWSLTVKCRQWLFRTHKPRLTYPCVVEILGGSVDFRRHFLREGETWSAHRTVLTLTETRPYTRTPVD